jgi:hypothetical protein
MKNHEMIYYLDKSSEWTRFFNRLTPAWLRRLFARGQHAEALQNPAENGDKVQAYLDFLRDNAAPREPQPAPILALAQAQPADMPEAA